ncbi:MAG: tetratricopeptide repeat protein [Planctomycetota bacterium]
MSSPHARDIDEMLRLGMQATAQGKSAQAVAIYREILERDEKHVTARNNLGCLLLKSGRIQEALATLGTERHSITDPAILNSLGYALMQAGQPTEAEQMFRRALASDPEDGGARNNLGMALLKVGRIAEAILEHQRVIRERPQSVESFINLGCAYMKAVDLENARSAFESALRIDPYSVDAHNNLGCCLRELGELEKSIEELTLAAGLEPQNPSIQLNLCLAFQRNHEHAKALSHLKRHLSYVPNAQDASLTHLLAELEHLAAKER